MGYTGRKKRHTFTKTYGKNNQLVITTYQVLNWTEAKSFFNKNFMTNLAKLTGHTGMVHE